MSMTLPRKCCASSPREKLPAEAHPERFGELLRRSVDVCGFGTAFRSTWDIDYFCKVVSSPRKFPTQSGIHT